MNLVLSVLVAGMFETAAQIIWTFIFAVAGVFLLIGIALLVDSLRTCFLAHRARSWPADEGELLSCRMEEHLVTLPTWQVVVRYAYEAEGRRFEGGRVMFGYAGCNWKSQHDKLFEQWCKLGRVRVHYQRNRPANAVLVTGVHRLNLSNIAFAVLWILFSIGFGFVTWKLGH